LLGDDSVYSILRFVNLSTCAKDDRQETQSIVVGDYQDYTRLYSDSMASRALEARFERMSVNDENEQPSNTAYTKPKVLYMMMV